MSQPKPRVLLVEYYTDLQSLNRLVLETAGYHVDARWPTEDVVAAAKQIRPDVIVVNIRPTVPSDWEIVDRLEADPETGRIPIVAMSTSPRVVAEAQATPAVRATVVMPYDIDALRAAVAQALGNPPPAAILPPAPAPTPATVVEAARLLAERSRPIVLQTIQELLEVEPFKAQTGELLPALNDHLPVILGALLTALQRGLSPEQLCSVPPIRRAIQEHAALRAREGLRPSALILEYQMLAAQIFAALRDRAGEAHFTAADACDVSRAISLLVGRVLCLAVDDFFEWSRHHPAGP